MFTIFKRRTAQDCYLTLAFLFSGKFQNKFSENIDDDDGIESLPRNAMLFETPLIRLAALGAIINSRLIMVTIRLSSIFSRKLAFYLD